MKRPIASFDIGNSRPRTQQAPATPVHVPADLDQSIERARRDVKAGRRASHAEVSQWLSRWGKGDPGPAPTPWKQGG